MSIVNEKMTERAIEQFLFKEADMLDAWQLEEWLQLFTEDGTYSVPTTDNPDGDSKNSLFLISDNYSRLKARVKRLSNKWAHSENPRSRTRRFITNVQIAEEADGEIKFTANFIVYRMRYGFTDAYVGKYYYTLVNQNGELKIKDRKAVLDLEALRPHSRVSIIL
ncbi:aromatic-ring-hydroxylating dioxygenase subunit beta [Niallia oryzisoli]|uniref:Aromatic-ring-hydroxylating dioxygenase subunit beta n=1 Tax=Niallia oryzisoli TaxID=1737571 RepID=A0ABZ2CIT1_9BACI